MSDAKKQLTDVIAVAAGDRPADIVFKHGRIVDVLSGTLTEGDVAVTNGQIVGIGSYHAKTVIDARGKWICPALIDGHVHIESSLLAPGAFADILAARGVATAITDPHEIANVLGTAGIRFMLARAEKAVIDIRVMLPSSVPATSFEHNGATLTAADLTPLLSHPHVLGLAEVMDFPAVRHADPVMLDKLSMAQTHGRPIDGHGAGLDANAINIYAAAGITTDHECTSIAEAAERLTRGMYVMIRQGTLAKDLPQLIDLVNERNSRRFLFCTDDKYPDDLMTEGSVDANVRLAIAGGTDPVIAVQMGSLNAAECFHLYDRGAIVPGRRADLLLLDDLRTFSVAATYIGGVCVAAGGERLRAPAATSHAPAVKHPLHFPPLSADQLRVTLTADQKAHVIGIIENSLVTRDIVRSVPVRDGAFIFDAASGVQKIAVIERHKGLGTVGVGLVEGFAMHEGAIATTIAHDSHNIVVTGCSDEDIMFATERLRAIGGGMTVVHQHHVLAELSLPIAGLMTEQSGSEAAAALRLLRRAASRLGAPKTFNPFLTLSFLSLPVIPDLKLTDTGLFDVRRFQHIAVGQS
ncbi:MAG: adenine deaminase [Sporolactobacillus sp.]